MNLAIEISDDRLRSGKSWGRFEPPFSVRHLYVKNAGYEQRIDFLNKAFDRELVCIEQIVGMNINHSNKEFNVFAISGLDSARISMCFRYYRPLLTWVPKICVLSDSSPSDRVRLLNIGFDNVFDIGRWNPSEVYAAVKSINSRYRLTHKKKMFEDENFARLDQICDISRLTKQQLFVLRALSDRLGSCRSIDFLCNFLSRDHNPVSSNHVRVLVSGLRRYLRERYIILSIPGQGYYLRCVENVLI